MALDKARLNKATLTVYSAPYNDHPQNIEFMFNPQEISFTRSVGWDSDRGNRGTSLLPKVNFAGLDPYEFTLQNLLFDTYEKKTSVMDEYINSIKEAVTAPNQVATRPPVYVFSWGELYYFHCVVTNLTYRLTMFLADGTPVRASVDIALREVDPQVAIGGNSSSAGSNAASSLFGDAGSGSGNNVNNTQNHSGRNNPPTPNPSGHNNPPTPNPSERNNPPTLKPPTPNPSERNNPPTLKPPTPNPSERNNPPTPKPPTPKPPIIKRR